MLVTLNGWEVIAVDSRWWFGLLLLLNDRLNVEKFRIFIHNYLNKYMIFRSLTRDFEMARMKGYVLLSTDLYIKTIIYKHDK